jgi:hypothetical protein
MTVLLKNNAIGYLSTPISASDVGLALETGDGANFPTLSAGEYFYATLVATNGETEVIKATARVSDTLTIVRAQDGSTAYSFAAGAKLEMRVNAATVEDAVADSIVTSLAASDITVVDAGGYYAATNVEAALQEVTAANKIRITDAGNFYTATNVEAALQEITAASKITITDAGNYYAATNVEAALQEAAQASNMDIADSGGYYTSTNVEGALQEAAQAGTIIITDPGNYYAGSTVNAALQEAAQASTTKITDAGNYYSGITVEAALQEIGASVAAIGPTPNAAAITIADAGNYYTGSTVEAALQEAAQASTTKITDTGNYYTSTNVEGALQEVGASFASSGANIIHAVGRVTAGAALSAGAIGFASVASGGTGIYNVTLSTAIADQTNIVPIATADHNGSTTASYTASCDVTSTTVIQVRIWSNGNNPVATNLGFGIVVYNTTP